MKKFSKKQLAHISAGRKKQHKGNDCAIFCGIHCLDFMESKCYPPRNPQFIRDKEANAKRLNNLIKGEFNI